MSRGLTATAGLWTDIRTTYAWVHRAAHLLDNADGLDVTELRRRYDELLAEMAEQQKTAGVLSSAVTHFLTVTDSYASGLFHCYAVPGLPRTNNDLEQYFGSVRYLERRTTGRKIASQILVIRGAVRAIAAVTTHQHPLRVADLCPVDYKTWDALRRTLDFRHETRRAQLRFRRAPDAYLAALEAQLIKLALPP